jgi:CHAD domain-containing protein
LIEIADDSVSILDPIHELDHFREIEVEATSDSPASRSALKLAVAALIAGGCRAERPVPKLVRALGRPALQPPSVVVAPVDRHASIPDLIRHLTASALIQILTHDPAVRLGHDPEAVHVYRVATRRLRSDLRTFARFVDGDPTDELRDELRWLGSEVGRVRDLDVLSTRFAANSRSLSDLDQPGASELLARLAKSRLEAHHSLLKALRSERYDRTLRTLVAFAANPPIATASSRKATRPAVTLASPLVKRRWNQLAAAVVAGGAYPNDEALHMIRIAAKRCRYAAEAVAPVVGRPARHFAARVEEVQTVLGDYHDTVVAEAWLRDTAVELVDGRVAIGGLIAAERQERAHLRDEWHEAWHRASRRKVRAWL